MKYQWSGWFWCTAVKWDIRRIHMCVCVRACAAPSLYFDITNLERVNNWDAEVIKKVEFHTLGSTVIMMTIRRMLRSRVHRVKSVHQGSVRNRRTVNGVTKVFAGKPLQSKLSDSSCYVSCQPPITQSKLFSHFNKQKQMTNCNKQTTMVKHCVRRFLSRCEVDLKLAREWFLCLGLGRPLLD